MFSRLLIDCTRGCSLKSNRWYNIPSLSKGSIKNLRIQFKKISLYKKPCSKSNSKLFTPIKFCLVGAAAQGLRIQWNGTVLCESTAPKKLPAHPKVNWNILLRLLWEDFWILLGAILGSLLAAFLNTLIPLSIGKVVNIMSDIIKPGSNSEAVLLSLKKYSVSLISLYCLQSLSTFAYISLLAVLGERLAFKLRVKLFKSIMNQDVEFFDRRRTGELVDCLSNDVMEFKSSFKTCINQGLRSTTQIAGCVVSLFYISPLMTSAMIVIIPSVIVVGTLFGSLLRIVSRKAQSQSLNATNLSEEVISNIRTVKAFSNEEKECESYKIQVQEVSRLNILLGCGIGVFQAGTNLFLNVIVLGTLYIGSHLITTQTLSPGDLMSFLVATQTIQRSFAQMSLLLGYFIKGKLAAIRILNFIESEPKISLTGGIKLSPHSFVPAVEFKDVSFSYPTRPNQVVLKNLSLMLPPGKTVAIVGASGNGKSTIVALLERFYDVSEGSITIGGIDIKELDVSWLRQNVIGLINQEPTLFATSIKENIRYGKPTATDEEVFEAARLANADNFIRSFPDGYETILGERGLSVSGGQKQRIALARVLIKNPSILILDEATSALDPESESVVQKTLEKICFGRTVLVIAHRLSTIQNADIIIVLNDCQVAEIGNHESLLARKGYYYNLMTQKNK